MNASLLFTIHHPGEVGAGLLSFTDEVTVTCKSGQWGGEPGEFEAYMRECLEQWYDGAAVALNDKISRAAESELGQHE